MSIFRPIDRDDRPRRDRDYGAARSQHARRDAGERPGRWWDRLAAFVSVMHRLSPGAACIWIAVFRNSVDGRARLSRDQLAAIVGRSIPSVSRGLRELVDADFLAVESRGARNRGATIYRLKRITGDALRDSKRITGATPEAHHGRDPLSMREEGDAPPPFGVGGGRQGRRSGASQRRRVEAPGDATRAAIALGDRR